MRCIGVKPYFIWAICALSFDEENKLESKKNDVLLCTTVIFQNAIRQSRTALLLLFPRCMDDEHARDKLLKNETVLMTHVLMNDILRYDRKSCDVK